MTAPVTQADRLTFPAMLPAEVAVFRGWLKIHEAEYSRFDYNVRIGPGFDPGDTVPADVRSQAILNTQKRIDAVAWKGNTPTIIEVKDRAGLSAIGQILGYEVLWRLDNPGGPPPSILLVARVLGVAVEPVLVAHNIPHELVVPA